MLLSSKKKAITKTNKKKQTTSKNMLQFKQIFSPVISVPVFKDQTRFYLAVALIDQQARLTPFPAVIIIK